MVSFDFGLVQEAGKSSRFARNDRFGVVIPNVERDLAKLNQHLGSTVIRCQLGGKGCGES
jgi:hypothetical protein